MTVDTDRPPRPERPARPPRPDRPIREGVPEEDRPARPPRVGRPARPDRPPRELVLGALAQQQGGSSAPAAADPAPASGGGGGDGSYPPTGLAEHIKLLPEWIQLGCGEAEYICPEKNAIFPGDVCPDALPDLSNHSSFMAETFKKSPDLYAQLKDRKTSLGVTLAKCIKTGVDNPGHPHIKTVGLVAGDEESYTVFKELFDPVISDRHGGFGPNAKHPTDLDLKRMHTKRLDPTGKYVLTTRVRTGRSIKGTLLPPSCTFEGRRELEKTIVNALNNLKGDLEGEYFPLGGSKSWAAKPTGMSAEKEEELRSAGNLFQEPDSTLLLSSGCGRHWPDARGIYHNKDSNCFVWVNEEDQMRIVSMQKGDDIQSTFGRFIRLCDEVQKVLKADGQDFMHNDHLGYILTCPSNLGTGLRAGAMVKIPLFSARADFKQICGFMGLQARGGGGVDSEAKGGIYDISNADRLGKSELELVNVMIEGVAQIVEWEQALERGENIDDLVHTAIYPPVGVSKGLVDLPDWIKVGCGSAEYHCEEKESTFPPWDCPEKMPDLSQHNNHMTEVLSQKPEIWDALRTKKTDLGVTLAKCIKTGMDNKGHPHIKTVGMVAGDEESYELFKDLFDPVIADRHGGYAADAVHPTNLNLEEVDQGKLDPDGKYVETTRVRTGRSIKGTRLPPASTFEERRELERIIVKGLLNLTDDLKGDYHPLHGSRSYAPKPTGMSLEKEEELRNNGNLFQEPDSTLLLASGCGRHWPDARGIYHNEAANCFVWVNEEDQMRIVSMEKSDNIQETFARFVKVCAGVEEVLKAEGQGFMHNDHLGYILTCPSNLGTGLRAGAMVNIPLLSAKDDFKARMKTMGLQARGGGGVDADAVGGKYDISNADRLGKSEVELVNIMIRGIRQCIEWEKQLEAGEEIGEAAEISGK